MIFMPMFAIMSIIIFMFMYTAQAMSVKHQEFVFERFT